MTAPDRQRRIAIVTAVPTTIQAFMRPHVRMLAADYDVTLISNGSPDSVTELLGPNVHFVSVGIERKISLVNDLRALLELTRLFRKERFDSVHSITPKAGLLSMVAARRARIPHRIHIFTGQVWATKTGMGRFILKSLDKVTASRATHVLTDSLSQRDFLIQNGVVREGKITVLADGSIAGVNLERFQFRETDRQQIRSEHNIREDALVFLFIGRLTRDKGVADLLLAFAKLAEHNTRVQLMVVGPDEDGLEPDVQALGERYPGRVHRVGYTDRPEIYFSAADVFCLPSYREGFGSVLIEAAAVGIPAIASRIYGVSDAVEDGVTGVLHTAASVDEIAAAMRRLAEDDSQRRAMGESAQQRAVAKFSEQRITQALVDYYHGMFSESSGK